MNGATPGLTLRPAPGGVGSTPESRFAWFTRLYRQIESAKLFPEEDQPYDDHDLEYLVSQILSQLSRKSPILIDVIQDILRGTCTENLEQRPCRQRLCTRYKLAHCSTLPNPHASIPVITIDSFILGQRAGIYSFKEVSIKVGDVVDVDVLTGTTLPRCVSRLPKQGSTRENAKSFTINTFIWRRWIGGRLGRGKKNSSGGAMGSS